MTETSDNSKYGNKLRSAKHIAVVNGFGLKKVHAKRLRDMYRSAGWPYLDVVEIELLAAGLLERLQEDGGHERMRVTDAGIQFLSQAANFNRQVKDPTKRWLKKLPMTCIKDGRPIWMHKVYNLLWTSTYSSKPRLRRLAVDPHTFVYLLATSSNSMTHSPARGHTDC